MQTLNESLEYMLRWMQNNLPEYGASFMPGLQFDEIIELVETLGFPLPEEIYELYQWRNGTRAEIPSFVFPAFEFAPLNKAAEIQNEINSDPILGELFTFNNQPLFPFIASEGRHCAIIISSRSTLTSPVVYIGKQGEGEYLAFSSVTSMMCGLAECFDTGAYYLDADGYIDIHRVQVAEVLRKHNPQLVEQALTDIRFLFTDFDLNYDIQMFISKTLQALGRLRPPETLEIVNEALARYSSDNSRKGNIICSLLNRTLNNLLDR